MNRRCLLLFSLLCFVFQNQLGAEMRREPVITAPVGEVAEYEDVRITKKDEGLYIVTIGKDFAPMDSGWRAVRVGAIADKYVVSEDILEKKGVNIRAQVIAPYDANEGNLLNPPRLKILSADGEPLIPSISQSKKSE